MRSTKGLVLTFAEKSKNILASNWQGYLHTVKADAKGSKENIHTSKVKYFFKKGKPYIWIPEKDLHNVNTILDERGSLAVTNPFPGPLGSLLRAIRKLPTRVALTGDIMPLRDEKVRLATESLRETISSERKTLSHASYSVSGILSSSSISCISRSENLQEVLDGGDTYVVHKFDIRSCTYIDGSGISHEVDLDDIEASKAELLSPYSERLIDGINQSVSRRRALMLFCFVYLNTNARLIEKDSMCLVRFLVRSLEMAMVNTNGRSSGSHSRKKHVTLKHFAAYWLKWKRRLLKTCPATVVWGEHVFSVAKSVIIIGM